MSVAPDGRRWTRATGLTLGVSATMIVAGVLLLIVFGGSLGVRWAHERAAPPVRPPIVVRRRAPVPVSPGERRRRAVTSVAPVTTPVVPAGPLVPQATRPVPLPARPRSPRRAPPSHGRRPVPPRPPMSAPAVPPAPAAPAPVAPVSAEPPKRPPAASDPETPAEAPPAAPGRPGKRVPPGHAKHQDGVLPNGRPRPGRLKRD